MEIQAQMTERAIELLNLPDETCLLLDIGCGSGLSGECLEEYGHLWVGMDISPHMLDVALERELEGDLMLTDIGQGVCFRPGSFDGAISISVLQWLCNADTTAHEPRRRLNRFFSSLYTSLARGARAVFQFYPENESQCELILSSALKCGFTGGLVVDYPNSSKAKKYFLCLFAGYAGDHRASPSVPAGLQDEHGVDRSRVEYAGRERHRGRRKGRSETGTKKDYILHKKELNRLRGKAKVPLDSKYTARKRRIKF
ncbi:Williams Beuren syndrome chromosome region 22 protein [Phlyctochytrium planicorne]|nr:Williams Beuren syndrome chromosome region 22 protein [Phlyctochytrium planicorne]